METTTPAANSACPPAPILPEQASVHASDRTVKSDDPMKPPLTRPGQTKLASQFCDDHVHWNVIYDPTNDQIQVYENNRVRSNLYTTTKKPTFCLPLW
jgi:hypothetical protein